MDRNQAKDLLPIIQAFAEGKCVETKTGSGWISIENMSFAGNPNSYRIKLEPKYRPFKNAEECWQEMLKHQPFGWIKSNEATEDVYFTITGLTNTCGFMLNSPRGRCFSGLYDYYTFADGTPFGVKVEE